MNQPVLVIIKPDGIKKKLVGPIIERFTRVGLNIIAARAVRVKRAIAREHYKNIKGRPFYKSTVDYFCGKYHKVNGLLAVIFYGDGAVRKCRDIAGSTDPRQARPQSIRGRYGKVTKSGIFENVVHVSSDTYEAEREIKLWFEPADITTSLYPSKIKAHSNFRKRVWS